MAELVNMQQAEYDEVLARMIKLHEEELTSTKNIMKSIRGLCERDGGFYVNQISGKVNMLLNCLEEKVLNELDTDFEASRQTMEAFMSAVKEIDTV